MRHTAEPKPRRVAAQQSRAVVLLLAASAVALSACGRGPAVTTAEPTPDSPVVAADAQQSPAKPQVNAEGQEVAYGELLDFTVGGNAQPLKVSGWSKAENGFTWSQGTAAIIAARVRPTDSPITMKLKAAGMIKEPELPFQPVEVYINNEKVADLQIGHTNEFSVAIPQGFTKAGGLLTVTFRTPKAASPKSLGQNEDDRVLGIRLFNLEFGQSV